MNTDPRLSTMPSNSAAIMLPGMDPSPPITMISNPFMVGTDPLSAHLHYARAICRRAERSALAVREAGHDLRALVPAYLNRLSDTLWLLAREAETGN